MSENQVGDDLVKFCIERNWLYVALEAVELFGCSTKILNSLSGLCVKKLSTPAALKAIHRVDKIKGW